MSLSLDPGRAADTGEYCDEGEFDFSRIEPELKARLDRLIAERSWKESGPPPEGWLDMTPSFDEAGSVRTGTVPSEITSAPWRSVG